MEDLNSDRPFQILSVAQTAELPRQRSTLLSTRDELQGLIDCASLAKIPIMGQQGPARFAGKSHEDYEANCYYEQHFTNYQLPTFQGLEAGCLSGLEFPHGVIRQLVMCS